MHFSTLLTLATLSTSASAHFRLLSPLWRGDSFTPPASQWIYPCANVNSTNSTRTTWSPSGGSLQINGSHPHALTQVNLALGSDAVNFNITLVPLFNQTGAGVFCLKSVSKDAMEAGFKSAGYSGLDDKRIEGLVGSVQVIQIGEGGGALYNCADIQFNATAQLLSDDQCKNGTGVSGVAIANVQSSQTSSASGSKSTNAASSLVPVVGSGLLPLLVAVGFL